MSRLARDGNRVLYVEPLGIRQPGLQDLSRIVTRLKHRLQAGRQGVRRAGERLYIHDPVIFPFQGSGINDALNKTIVLRTLKGIIRRLDFATPIIWTYLPTPLAVGVIDGIDHRLLVYDCVDALALNPKGVIASYAQTERQLVRQADIVFVTSQKLYAEKKPLNSHVVYVPAGVDVEHFVRQAPVPGDLARIRPPRIGFFGGIDERLDFGLLEHLANTEAGWSIVMIGPVRTDVTLLERCSNVFFLDSKRYGDLPAYLSGLDVLIMPYLVNEYTTYIYPAKLHECLATGKPTVATDLPELAPFREVIEITEGKDHFVRGVASGLAENDVRIRCRRLEVARANSWEARYRQITETILQRLTERAI